MQAITPSDILTWSTSEVPASERFDYFADALRIRGPTISRCCGVRKAEANN